ncbi:hypothetical protein H4582DRAFT_469212 [Lactarius indigo]|nr:hypothetical protein H4582DRAFT_469212 [Lactarius indigo]
MVHPRHSPQTAVQCPCDPTHVSDLGYSTRLWSPLAQDADISYDTLDSSQLASTAQQNGNSYSYSTVGQVDATANIYNPVVAGSSDHQPLPTFSGLDETSEDDNLHERLFVALSSLLDLLSGPPIRVEVPDSQFAGQVDSMANGAWRNARFDSDTSQTGELVPTTTYRDSSNLAFSVAFLLADDQTPNESRVITDVVSNSSDHRRYKTEETQIPMMPFGSKLECSYPPTSFKCSTSGSRRPRMKYQEASRASPIHKEGEHLVDSALDLPSQSCTPQDGGMRVETMAKKQYQCSSCWVIFAQRQGLSRHRKDKHEPKNQCGFCTVFTWSKGRHYNYQRHLREKHPEAVQSLSVSATPTTRRRGVNVGGWHSCQGFVVLVSDPSLNELAGLGCGDSLV